MSETIALTNSNVSGGMIIKLQKKGKHNPVLEATILFNALTEHLPGGTMTELYRQFVKSSRLFDPAAPDLLAVAEKTDELIQMFVGINSRRNRSRQRLVMHINSHPSIPPTSTGRHKCKRCRLYANRLKRGKCPYCGGEVKEGDPAKHN